MPRYFFNTQGDEDGSSDTDGVELPDRSVARSKAIRLAGAMTAADPETLKKGGVFVVHVTDVNDVELIVVRLTLAVDEG